MREAPSDDAKDGVEHLVDGFPIDEADDGRSLGGETLYDEGLYDKALEAAADALADGYVDERAFDQAEVLVAMVAGLKDSAQRELDAYSFVYSNVEVRAVAPGTIEWVYTVVGEIDPAVATVELDRLAAALQEDCDSIQIPIMTMAGITDEPAVRHTYLNPDGTEIWSHTC
ncbi:hypothetical protein Xcel_1018 [Xylanimonas cellulosilytica DSM 15894]|uniref:Uncharacterized protein n=1 Tax=Xylanimonas cellulosilytica (strain DSM 15894 / JCM 12276 / CECT 5975 / KCTC 9989 / LMG 20990 / NBRC 107835 / XIL07) TaxID=446471 RepID=D1BYX4_XYLCX|nr:hypothetical protein [Xylanimonas cellulosilytica]ACZ30049.1 hypothetical protein Xcel_1018 [Xylanimonas cellulosilytica DSM 15894]